MKTELIEQIKQHNYEFYEDSTNVEFNYKNFNIQLSCSPYSGILELEVWDELTETEINFTHNEIDDLIIFFDDLLQNHYQIIEDNKRYYEIGY